MANIKVFKLTNNEDVLGEVESIDDDDIILNNPVGIAIVRDPKTGQPNVGFAPFPLHAEQKSNSTVALPKKSVVYSYVPAQDFLDNYNQIFGSGIVVPPEKKLIVG
jgi:hypothetical protein